MEEKIAALRAELEADLQQCTTKMNFPPFGRSI